MRPENACFHAQAQRVKGFHNRQAAEEVLTSILAHRVWADLRKGWRFTNPNLEEAGLVEVRFPGLGELASDDEEFAANPRLADSSPQLRAKLFTLLFDYMRRGLAIATEALDNVPELASFPFYSWHHAIIVPQGHPLLALEKCCISCCRGLVAWRTTSMTTNTMMARDTSRCT